jgi:hypothetical protein
MVIIPFLDWIMTHPQSWTLSAHESHVNSWSKWTEYIGKVHPSDRLAEDVALIGQP